MINEALATARLSRLVVDDKITEPMRDYVMGRWPDGNAVYFVNCRSCTSLWAAMLVVVLSRSRIGRPLVRMLAWSELAIALRAGTEWLETAKGSS